MKKISREREKKRGGDLKEEQSLTKRRRDAPAKEEMGRGQTENITVDCGVAALL
jgi:hypothetical protein